MKKVSGIIDPLWTIMKLSALQLFLAFLAGAASFARESRAQELLYKKVSIHAEHKPIKEILMTLEAKANVKFVYSLQLLPVNRRVSIDIENKTLAETLDKMFSPDNISYETVNKKIVLKLLPAGSSLITDPLNEDAFPGAGQADEKLVTGKVSDDKNAALPGVNIAIRGTTTGTITDADGKFSLRVAEEHAVLVFSYVGYVSKQVQLEPGQTALDVSLVTDEKALSEVVVIGYGTAKKKDVTGAVSTLSAQAYKDQPVVNASSALQGRVPGVTVVNNSGAPGGGVKIRVRGANSINASNDPLYVVDGVALSSIGIQELNVNDIESMDILKDASATAVYGSRGANGVIIITTKSGKSGPPKIEYNGFASFNRPMKLYKLMDAPTYANVANVVVQGSFPDPNSYAGKSTDWQRLIFDNSVTQSHQISATGGSESTKYYVSGFYIDQQGLLINSGQKRFGLRTNVNIKISRKLNFGVNLYAGRINSLNNGDIGSKGNPVTSALTWAPTEAVYDSPGVYNRTGVSPIWGNPYMTIKERLNQNFANVGVFSGVLKYTITDWLTLNINAGLDMRTSKGAYLNNQWVGSSMGSGQNYGESYTFQNNNVLNFHKTFDKHDITATALMESTSNTNSGFAASGSGLASTSNGYNNLGLNAAQSISSSYLNWALLSYMGRIAYDYNDRYLVTATIRRDGSSKFQGKNKWSNFPSFSVGWKLNNERFIQNLNLFSHLKLRAGWGVTGNQAIAPYSTLGLLNPAIYSYGTGTVYQGYTLGNPANPNVKWETSAQTNIGLEMGFFGDRLNITAEYYHKNTRDLLLFSRVPVYDGGGTFLQNIGKVRNKGFELLVEATPVSGNGLTWNTSVNLSVNKNKVINMGQDSMIVRNIIGGGLISNNIQVVKVGQPLGAFYLIPWAGVHQQADGALNAQPGDYKYTDVSGNNSIGFEDRVIAGSATPTLQWGFNNSFKYKGFELNVFVQGSHGNKIFNASYAGTAVPTSDVKFITLADAANYWTPSNPSSEWANPGSKNKAWVESTQFLQDGGYVRLKNVSLSYQLPRALLKGVSAKVYASIQNFYTLTKYKGYDPEATSTESNSDADAGIDLGAYPSPKTFTVGLRLGF